MLNENIKAPNITLVDKDGNLFELEKHLGKKVVVYFYPKDNTPGCSVQAQLFASEYAKFKDNGIEVIGISKDSIKSHCNFAKKYDLPFILLSDPELKAIQDYDVWKEKKLYGKTYMGVVRATYLIDERGFIEKVWPKADPKSNATEILEYLGIK